MSRGRIPEDLLQKIKAAINIIDVVGEHVVLRKAGANHMGLCPFHAERTPSFSVSENKQVYICYGCKASGDLIRFVQDKHMISFREAVEELAERARIPLPKDWSGGGDDPEMDRRRAEQREKLSLMYKLNHFTAAFYHQELSRQQQVQRYFANRGVGPSLVQSFYLGAAPASWDALASHFSAKKAPLPVAAELGLIRPSQKTPRPGGPGFFDLFRNRAMFPIIDARRRVAGFGGRALPAQDGAEDSGPKYLNSSDSQAFQKGKLAFGLFQAQSHIREVDEVVLVEGYFDVLALHAGGFRNAVASCGTALTTDHLAMFRKIGSRITLLFDGDRAGADATVRAMETGLQEGIVLYGAVMPEGLDPDEVLFDQKNGTLKPDGVERMKAILGAAKPLLDERLAESVLEAKRGPDDRTKALKQVARWLGMFSDPVARDVRVEAICPQLSVSKELFMKAFGEVSSRSAPARPVVHEVRTPVAKPKTSSKPVKLRNRERLLLSAMANVERFGAVLDEASRNLPPQMGLGDLFEHEAARAFVSGLTEQADGWRSLAKSPGRYLTSELDPQLCSVLAEALMPTDKAALDEMDVKVAVGQSLGRAWARFSQQIKAALSGAEANKDAGLHSKLLKDYLDVQRKMKEFSSLYDEE